MWLFKKDITKKELKSFAPIVNKINDYYSQFQSLSDGELRQKTIEFKNRYNNGETLDNILPEAYALVKVASARTIGLVHYDEQLMGGIALHRGEIAEMATGEGKTLVATLPAYLNALTGNGVHIVTVNDYLAKRDANEMGQVFSFLGMTTGCVVNSCTLSERQQAYACDITYITNKELAFDYLRDNMAVRREDITGNRFNYGIIDEVDSILIDEARTPFIISAKSNDSAAHYYNVNLFVKTLERGEDLVEKGRMDYMLGDNSDDEKGDFRVDEKNKIVILTKNGIKKAEKTFGIENLSDIENIDLMHYIQTCLKAHYLMANEKDYIVKDGCVFVVDEFTGRIMEGRRFNNGLHQALEAKENVEILEDSKTIASITFQNLFNRYQKKCGMTGTAITEEKEFKEIYDLQVVVIPTHKPCIRVDKDDLIYKTHTAKVDKIVSEVTEAYEIGQPVLVGTATIEQSEEISKILADMNIPHTVLNAKYHEKEAEIVSHAGEFKAVTIATNMAGRGTDIKLDEQTKDMGLKIIGTNRHESRRIDNQLRGRSGRQGDRGETQFILSLDDEIIRLFGGDMMKTLVTTLNLPEDLPLEHPLISKNVERAQKLVEGNNYEIRKKLYDYDLILNEQCEIIYKQRAEVLNNGKIHDNIIEMIKDVIDECISENDNGGTLNTSAIKEQMATIFNLDSDFNLDGCDKGSEAFKKCFSAIIKKYDERKYEFFVSEEEFTTFENIVFLKIIDKLWENHINTMTELRKSIGLQSYANKDPLVEYKIIGGDLFDNMLHKIKLNVCSSLFNSVVTRKSSEEIEKEQKELKENINNEEESVKKDNVGVSVSENVSIDLEQGMVNTEKTTLLQN